MQADTTHYVVGLGNPGPTYAASRHNVGWRVLDAWRTHHGLSDPHHASRWSGRVSEGVFADTPVTLLYPDTFMNNSGQAVKKLVATDAAARLIVVYDDVDIAFGSIKVSVGGGAAGHNGVQSVAKALGTTAFIRLRVGIAPRHVLTRRPVRPSGNTLPTFVLQPFTGREERQLPAVLDTAVAALDTILVAGAANAMNRFNG